MLVLVRCDDRLIHGQCMTVIIHEYDVERILVVDDFTATNPILKTVFQAAAPPSIQTGVYTVQEAVPLIQSAMEDQVRTLVLMKSPLVYRALRAALPGIPAELNIGPMSNRKGSISVTYAAHLIPEEAAAIKELAADHVHVYFRQIPSQKTVEWDEVKDKFQ
ncbi:MAG TPA: PTS sugar transporter subunit IIB [Pseudoflavonifractor sp.]|nr:PTS sugar transporter subunit IIB [Pseudoflavonifractor sp.]